MLLYNQLYNHTLRARPFREPKVSLLFHLDSLVSTNAHRPDADDNTVGFPCAVSYAPHNSPVLGYTDDRGTLCLWNTEKANEDGTRDITRYKTHNNAVFDLAWNPRSERVVATAGGDGKAVVWDMEKIRCNEILEKHSASVKCVRWNPNHDGMWIFNAVKQSGDTQPSY